MRRVWLFAPRRYVSCLIGRHRRCGVAREVQAAIWSDHQREWIVAKVVCPCHCHGIVL